MLRTGRGAHKRKMQGGQAASPCAHQECPVQNLSKWPRDSPCPRRRVPKL